MTAVTAMAGNNKLQELWERFKRGGGFGYLPLPQQITSLIDLSQAERIAVDSVKLVNDVEHLERELRKIGIRISYHTARTN